MAGFIHLEVSWDEQPQLVDANVRRMLGAVAHYPWHSTWIVDVSAARVCCVMAVQRGPGATDPARESSAAPPRDAPSVHIAADVQLHARWELEQQLGIDRAQSPRLTDADLVLRAYQRWGLAFGERLLGEGAVALWDAAAQRLVCWRDSAGVRPLYYHHVPGRRLVVSSDLQSLAAHPATPSRFDLPYTRAFLGRGIFQHPTRTFIDGVRKVPPAHLLRFDRGGLQLQSYWEPGTVREERSADDREGIEEFRSLLRQAIEDRLADAGAGVGAHLSGGLDSSSVAVMASAMVQDRGHTLSTFSWAPPRDVVPPIEGHEDERELVETVAQYTGLRPRYTCLQPADLIDFTYRDVALRPREALTFELATSRLAADAGVRTIFSGWGGDETIAFNGRGYFADLARRGRFTTIQRELGLRSRIQGGTVLGAWKHRVLTPLLPGRALRMRRELPPLPSALRPEFRELLGAVDPLGYPDLRERAGVHRMQAALLRSGHLHYRMESWAAHGAALGIAYTFPLLDRRIVELAFRLPGRMFFRDGWKRWLYRTSMEGILPDAVRWNAWKYDNAAGRHLRDVRARIADLNRARLLERQDNPLVDVGLILAARTRAADLGDDAAASGSSTEYVGGGEWLAFTRLLPA